MAARKKVFDIDVLWRLQRLGALSISPDGSQAVCSLTRHSMEENKASTSLWLLSTLGGHARQLTQCGEKDGQPHWSPTGEAIAFVSKREQEGKKDDEPQLYLIAPDGGEARRLTQVSTGVEAFKWFPDGRRIAFLSWVWPELRGGKAQAKRAKEWRDRKETGHATSEALYRHWDHFIPQGRVPHLHVVDVASGKVNDLFEGTPYEVSRAEPSQHCFDIAPDGRRIVFAHDPAEQKQHDARFALVELELRSSRFATVAREAAWTFFAPCYSPRGERIAFLASHQGLKHTMPTQIATWERETGRWQVESAEWDHEVNEPLQWEDDGLAVLCTAEQRGRKHLWRFDLPDRRAERVHEGGWVDAFAKAAGTTVVACETALHPAHVLALLPGERPRRIETFNDDVLQPLRLGRSEETQVTGALGDAVQVWVTYPPAFDAKKKYPLLHVIHGGPHSCFGDQWHYRWNAQVLAAAGYVVACVNYHGSSGFGYAFLDSITHRWGELELQDVEAATTALLRQPWADKKRVFASGGSYGGFMVAWMNGHVPRGRYAAYVCHAGCFDWRAMFADDAYTWHSKELGGWYWDAAEKIDAQSPHHRAGDMQTPTLVIHGALDYRVPDAQGLAYYNTLKARGVPARLLWFPDENHWVVKPRNSALWYREFLQWLAAHDSPIAARGGKAR